jgi:hypothetical protein
LNELLHVLHVEIVDVDVGDPFLPLHGDVNRVVFLCLQALKILGATNLGVKPTNHQEGKKWSAVARSLVPRGAAQLQLGAAGCPLRERIRVIPTLENPEQG